LSNLTDKEKEELAEIQYGASESDVSKAITVMFFIYLTIAILIKG